MKTRTSDGYDIHWKRYGTGGSVVVMLHSLGSDSDMWAPQVETLSASFDVITVDTRGHGASSVPDGPYALEQLCADVLAVADDIGSARFHVVGLSLGGQMALWLAAHHPERVISMTASNTAAKIGTDETWGARIEAVRSQGMATIRPSVVERWFSSDLADRHPDWYEAACATFERTDPTGYIGCCHALAAADLRTDVARITAPSLIVGADGDLSTPPEQARWLAEHIAGAELAIIEGAGHLSNLDQRAAFDHALTGLLGAT